jgi:hypothetical protein
VEKKAQKEINNEISKPVEKEEIETSTKKESDKTEAVIDSEPLKETDNQKKKRLKAEKKAAKKK